MFQWHKMKGKEKSLRNISCYGEKREMLGKASYFIQKVLKSLLTLKLFLKQKCDQKTLYIFNESCNEIAKGIEERQNTNLAKYV